MERWELEGKAFEEAQRLIDEKFSFFNPYTVQIDDDGVPFAQAEEFYSLVEKELLARGEEIHRPVGSPYFKIKKYQAK